MSDQPRTHKFSHKNGEVGSDGNHTVLQVIIELSSVFLQLQHLLAKGVNVDNILNSNFCSHGNFRSFLDPVLQVLLKERRKV